MKVKMAHEAGRRVSLRRYWGEGCHGTIGRSFGYHNAHLHLLDSPYVSADGFIRHEDDALIYPEGKPPAEDPRWNMKCEGCGLEAPDQAERQLFIERLWDTPSGELEPYYMYWATWMHSDDSHACIWWDNCRDPRGHLYVVLPTTSLHPWDTDGRASNCGLPNDRNHKCWVRHGDPDKDEIVHIDKNGNTCNAGAGSIMADGWHGFLHNGDLYKC